MGLKNESAGGGNFLQVIYGEISQRVNADTEGAVERTNKLGKVVHELKFNALEGTLKKVWVYESKEFQDSWVFVIDDGKKEYNLTVPYSSGYANGLLTRLPNLDFTRPLKILSYWIEGDDGKSRGFLTFNQGGKIEKYFTKEDPHGLPDMKEVTVSGKKVWDDTDRLTFLRKMVDEKVNPKLAELYPVDHVEVKEVEQEVEATGSDEGVDDLPFAILALVSVGTLGFQLIQGLPF